MSGFRKPGINHFTTKERNDENEEKTLAPACDDRSGGPVRRLFHSPVCWRQRTERSGHHCIGTSVAHVSGYASGLYLLSIPLIVGSAENPDTITFGEDSVNVTAVTKMVTKKSKELKGSKTIDLVSMTGSTNIPIPIPFIFYWKTATVSGNSVK